MTISTTTIKNSYSGNGSTTTFNYTFKITDQDDIDVIIRSSTGVETTKTITTHYTVINLNCMSYLALCVNYILEWFHRPVVSVVSIDMNLCLILKLYLVNFLWLFGVWNSYLVILVLYL